MSEPALKAPMQIKTSSINAMGGGEEAVPDTTFRAFEMPSLPPGVIPTNKAKMALDAQAMPIMSWANSVMGGCFQGFLGYPYLAEQTQISEFRALSEARSGEMVRKWVKMTSSSAEDKTWKLKEIEQLWKKLRVREMFRRGDVYDGFFGHGLLYIDVGVKDQKEDASPLLEIPQKVTKGSFRGLKLIDPMVTSPYLYNSTDPTADDYYKPRQWWVMGRQVSATRLLRFASRPVPDMLKPAYNFGGMSLTQLALDCVQNWRKVRDSVTQMVESYSICGIKTNMGTVLQGGSADSLVKRAQLFNRTRSNRGLFMVDKDTEEFFNASIPLGSLDKLQAQAQEHMAAVGRIPLIVLLGITPSGLNASSEGEIRAFYDYISEQQNISFRDNLEKVFRISQLSLWGAVDPELGFEFEPLWQMDDEALSRIRKSDADAAVQYDAIGAIGPNDIRKKLANDPKSGYEGLDVHQAPPPVDPAITQKKAPLLASVQGLSAGPLAKTAGPKPGAKPAAPAAPASPNPEE